LSTSTSDSAHPRHVEKVDRVVIRFAGDSGDGMQLTGTQFTATAAAVGNDLATFPDYPAEIRATAGTIPGVSGFQVNFSSEDIFTPGDAPDVLVAMNPAALKVNVKDLKPNGIVIVNTDSFKDTDLAKAGYHKNPLDDGSLAAFRVHPVEITCDGPRRENFIDSSLDSEPGVEEGIVYRLTPLGSSR
jgi:2-oxoglutarate ferredoxin oxidoreductase subunit alpha